MPEQKHSIKISECVYRDLLQLQRPRETMSQVIDRLIQVAVLMVKVEPLLKSYEEHFERQLAERLKE